MINTVWVVIENYVAIPYSSGIGLRLMSVYAYTRVSTVAIPYSSGIGLRFEEKGDSVYEDICRNPLFIRDRSSMFLKNSFGKTIGISRNPLFIRDRSSI